MEGERIERGISVWGGKYGTIPGLGLAAVDPLMAIGVVPFIEGEG